MEWKLFLQRFIYSRTLVLFFMLPSEMFPWGLLETFFWGYFLEEEYHIELKMFIFASQISCKKGYNVQRRDLPCVSEGLGGKSAWNDTLAWNHCYTWLFIFHLKWESIITKEGHFRQFKWFCSNNHEKQNKTREPGSFHTHRKRINA